MILRSLTTENFRNLAAGEIPFHAAVNIVLGRNGQGKTNLLEAVYFLATTKSFRTNRIASVFRFDSPNVHAAGALERDGITRTLSVGFAVGKEQAEGRRRVLMINGEKIALPAYLNAMSVFAYSQSRLEIIRGAPEEKRRFLDRGIAGINTQYLDQLSRYNRVLKQRNALLADDPSASSLEAWNDEFVAAAAPIHRARAAYAQEIAEAYARIVEKHGYHLRDLEIVYRGSGEEEKLRETLARIRRHELRARMTLTGPQRDTIDFVVGGRNAAEVLSGGELKMIVLFLKFAKVELFRGRHDEPPLFLLDDIDAELDLEVLQKLLSGLPLKTQVFATSAKESFLQALEAGPHRRLVIENGQVTSGRDFP
ncbi:MAG TPA: DNA replication and repair protein RecF [Thermoanaerobaculia bacterium]